MNIQLLGLLVYALLFFFLIVQKRFRKWKKAGLVLVSFALTLFMAFQYIVPFNTNLSLK